jgi:hypothetical protein
VKHNDTVLLPNHENTGKTTNIKRLKPHYTNSDKTLTQKFYNNFSNKIQTQLKYRNLREHEIQLIKNQEQKSKYLL